LPSAINHSLPYTYSFIVTYYRRCLILRGILLIYLFIDSITLIATKRFKSNFIKNAFQGKNYRAAWATPIKVPVKFLDEIQGGIIPLEMGGGFQTLSMDLQGKKDIVYTLRSVNKNPDELIPDIAHKLNLGF